MNRWKGIVTKWKKKKKNYDSDSTGYCSSSDICATSPKRPLTGSQFILRRNALLRVNSIDSTGPTYISLDTGTCPSVSYSLVSSSTSSLSLSTANYSSTLCSSNGNESSTLTCGTDDETTLRAASSASNNENSTYLSYDYRNTVKTLPAAKNRKEDEKRKNYGKGDHNSNQKLYATVVVDNRLPCSSSGLQSSTSNNPPTDFPPTSEIYQNRQPDLHYKRYEKYEMKHHATANSIKSSYYPEQEQEDDLSGNYTDDEADEIETLDGRGESRCCYMSPIYGYTRGQNNHFSPTRSIDVLSYQATPPPQIHPDCHFEEQVETELGILFDSMEVEENDESLALTDTSLLRRKKLQIKEATTKIYYPHEDEKAYTLDPKRDKKARKSKDKKKLSAAESSSLPRPILKKGPTPFVCHIYEEIEGDYLDPLPNDVRPDPPPRPYAQPINVFPPCSTFQPRINRFPSMRKRKKLPSLHHSNSFATFLRKRLKLSAPSTPYTGKTL